MFSGIISEIGTVLSAKPVITGMELKLSASRAFSDGIKTGFSVAVNGACLTVVSFKISESEDRSELDFIVVKESLNRTNLNNLTTDSCVNLERSIKIGDEIGGHLLSGHIDCQITTSSVQEIGEGKEIVFELPDKYSRYVFEKGYVALNGASITVAKKEGNTFKVALIPETLTRTNLGLLKQGDRVNLEIDRQSQVIVETVERYLKNNTG